MSAWCLGRETLSPSSQVGLENDRLPYGCWGVLRRYSVLGSCYWYQTVLLLKWLIPQINNHVRFYWHFYEQPKVHPHLYCQSKYIYSVNVLHHMKVQKPPQPLTMKVNSTLQLSSPQIMRFENSITHLKTSKRTCMVLHLKDSIVETLLEILLGGWAASWQDGVTPLLHGFWETRWCSKW